jgi:hypothetical protein
MMSGGGEEDIESLIGQANCRAYRPCWWRIPGPINGCVGNCTTLFPHIAPHTSLTMSIGPLNVVIAAGD